MAGSWAARVEEERSGGGVAEAKMCLEGVWALGGWVGRDGQKGQDD